MYLNPFAPGDIAFSPPLFFRFSYLIFFLFLGIQQASFWQERFLGKLLGSQDQMKGKVGGQWNKIFMEIFRSMLHVFLPVFFVVLFLFLFLVSLTELCSFWYGLKDLCASLRTKLSLAIKTNDVTSGGKDVVPYGRLRGEWVNQKTYKSPFADFQFHPILH